LENHTLLEDELKKLLAGLRSYKGLVRKTILAELLDILGEKTYDDAGSFVLNGKHIVVSTDGIVESLVKEDPWLAGFYSVVVNVNDVVAKGAQPVGYTCVVSSGNPKVCSEIVEGVKYGLEKYQLKFLKGHTHPDTSFDSIDASVVGVANNFLSSSGAKPEDNLVLAIDLNGNPGSKGWVRIFDSVIHKSAQEIQKFLSGIIEIAEKSIATASRDISGPGIVGTIGMLCESSHVGAKILLDVIPKPEKLELSEWLITYPSMGFVFSTENPKECQAVLKSCGFTTRVIGEISENPQIEVCYKSCCDVFIDFRAESIFGFKNFKGKK